MNTQEVLAIFDQERRELAETGRRREVTPTVVRDIGPDGGDCWISYSHNTSETIDAVIASEIAYFRALGRSFEWKVFDHDQPPNLRERLVTHGLIEGEAEAFMALDIAEAPAMLLAPVRHEVRRVDSPDDLADYRTVSEQAWGEERGGHVAYVADQLRNNPDEIGVYVAYINGVPASCARASYPKGSQFAGMWAGATVTRYRKRGLYQALVATRVQEARERGYRFMTIDALPTSRPIVERLGFSLLTFTYPLEWHTPEHDD